MGILSSVALLQYLTCLFSLPFFSFFFLNICIFSVLQSHKLLPLNHNVLLIYHLYHNMLRCAARIYWLVSFKHSYQSFLINFVQLYADKNKTVFFHWSHLTFILALCYETISTAIVRNSSSLVQLLPTNNAKIIYNLALGEILLWSFSVSG